MSSVADVIQLEWGSGTDSPSIPSIPPTNKAQNFLPEHTRRFLAAIMSPGTCLEMRVFKAGFLKGGLIGPAGQYSVTLAGWYDNPESLISDAARLRGISGFVTFNPVRRDLLARSFNKLVKCKHTTTDNDILAIRWLYIDIDPVRPADISSTNEELALAIERRDLILADHPEIREAAIWGRSGNGAWILAKLPDYPNDEHHRGLIARALAVLDERYSDDRVKIDRATKNPARVMCLAGAVKAKGSHRPERPWRIASIDGDAPPAETLDLDGWLDENEPEAAPQGRAGGTPGSTRLGGRLSKYVAAALEKEAAAVASAPEGERNKTLNRAALAMGELIARGELTRAEVEQTLATAARSIGLEETEIVATMNSGIEAGLARPRNLDHVGNGKPLGKPPKDGKGDDDDECEVRAGFEDNPHDLARAFRGQNYGHADGWRLRSWADQFWAWQDGCYRPIPTKEIKGRIADMTADRFDKLYHDQVAAASKAPPDDKSKAPRPIPVTTTLVNNVVQALGGMTLMPRSDFPDQPCWIDDKSAWTASECVPTKNAIVHLPSFADGLPCTRKPTPNFSALTCCPTISSPTRPTRNGG